MEIKKIDGIEYILKTEVDDLVRKRLSPMSERARTAESRIEDMSKKLEESQDGASRYQEQKKRIEQLEKDINHSRAQYQSHTTISAHGFTDPNLRDMVEWTYKREMENRPEESRQKLNEWLGGIRENPESAPLTIRPHLGSTSPPAAAPAVQATTPTPQIVHSSAPPVNNSVVPTNGTTSADLITNALRDPEMYRAKHEEIKATWYAQRKKGLV